MSEAADFLHVPARGPKPRAQGLTHVLDTGVPPGVGADLLGNRCRGGRVEVGWGTAYVDPAVEEKVKLLRRHGVGPCIGGTLLEVAWLQGATESFLAWAAALGFPSVEVSNGASGMPVAEKRRLNHPGGGALRGVR